MDQATDSGRIRKVRLTVEISVVLLVLWLPAFWGAVWRIVAPGLVDRGMVDRVSFLLLYAGRAAILLFIMAGAQEGLAHFGFDRFGPRRFWTATATACAALLAMCVVLGWFRLWAPALLPSPRAGGLGRPAQAAWFLLVSVPVASAWEELLLRGFLVTRLLDLWGSKWQAVGIAVMIGGLAALGGGAAGAALTLAVGVVYGVAFVRCRSIWPVLGAHVALSVFLASSGAFHR